MGFFAILILSVLVVGGNLLDKTKDNQVEKKKIEVIVNKPIETRPAIKEITPEPVKKEITPEPVKEEITPEPVKEVAKELDDLEDPGTNYLRLVLYIIGGLLVTLTGMYFFSRKRNSTPLNIQPESIEPQPAEEEAQPETIEPQPAEKVVQSETTEEEKTEEEENNNK